MRRVLLLSTSFAAIMFAHGAMADNGVVNLQQDGTNGMATVEQNRDVSHGGTSGTSNSADLTQDSSSDHAQITVMQKASTATA